MKAITILEPGPPEVLTEEDVPLPIPYGQEVRVKVHAFGINRADLSQRRGHYPAPPGEPVNIPGLEFAGEVELLGETALGKFPVGSRVCGIVGGGAYAESLAIHERLLMPIPEGMGYPEAAAIPEAFLTAFDAMLYQADLRPGEKILVHAAASGVGTAAIQIARALGCTVFAASRTREKLEFIKPLGVDFAIHSVVENIEKVIERETSGAGVDVIIDFVGGSALEENIRCLAPKGRLVLVGLLGGSDAPLNLTAVMRKRLTIRGTVLRSRPLEEKITLISAFSKQMLPLFQKGVLKPVLTKTFGFSQIREVHQLMEDNQTSGKVVVAF